MTSPADTNSEPSIEEILDSIRQIIADDEEGEPASAPKAAAATASPPPPPAVPSTQTTAPEEVIELTERVQVQAPKQDIIVDMQEPAPEQPAAPPPRPPAQTPQPETRRVMTPPPADSNNLDSIMTARAEAATMEAFSELAQRAAIEKGGGITIEDVVRYEVRPLLRAWIDKYLPAIVERLVQKELDKIAKRFEQE